MKNRAVKILLGISVSLIIFGCAFYKFHPHRYALVDAKEPSCTENGYSNYKCWCGAESHETISAVGHNYRKEIVDATCTKDGKEVYTCSNCSDTYEEIVKAMGHNYKEEITKEPSCTEEGTKTLTCDKCGDTYTESIEPLGHSFVDGICERCGKLSEEKKQEESKKKTDNGGSQKPSGNSGQTGNNVSNETPTNDTSAGAAAWGFGGGSVDTSDWSTRGGGTGAHAE